MNKTMEHRFWNKVLDPAACWEWRGTKVGAGYGQFYLGSENGDRVRRGAHRVAYELLVGPIPDDLELDHLCRNRSCVNPGHLEPVTHEVNMERSESLSAVNSAKTHCPAGHEYTPDNIYWVGPTKKSRKCKTCTKIRARGGTP